MRESCLVVVILICFAGTALSGEEASRYEYIGTVPLNGKKVVSGLDKHSLKLDGDILDCWVKQFYPDKKDVMLHFRFACGKHQLNIDRVVAYGSNGEVAEEQSGGKWEPITPNTIAERIYDKYCPVDHGDIDQGQPAVRYAF